MIAAPAKAASVKGSASVSIVASLNKLIVCLKANPKVINTISACVLLILAVYIAATQNF